MRCGSRPEGPDPHVRLRPGTVRICESGTASNYGSGIKNWVSISYRTGTRPNFVFWCIKKLLNDRIWVQYSDLDLPVLIRVHQIIALLPRMTKMMTRNSPEDDYRYQSPVKVLKSFEKFKHKMFASSGSHSGSVADDGSTDLDPDLSLDPGAE